MEPAYENGLLDEFDLELIRELELDARKSFLQLAAALDTSTTTVRRRLGRLLDEGLISFVTIANPGALGYLARVEIGVTVVPGKTKSVADKLSSHTSIQHLLATTGSHDIMGTLVIRNFEDLLSFIERDLSKISGITGINTNMHLREVKNDWPYLGSSVQESTCEINFRDLDPLDISLIGELEKDPRRTISAIAKDLGANRGVLGRRLQMLLDDRIIKIISIPDLLALGYRIWAIISVQVEAGSIESVADQLKRYPNVTHVVLVTGNFQIKVSAVFQTRAHMYDFLGDELGSIRGVIGHDTALHLKTYKRNLALVTQAPN